MKPVIHTLFLLLLVGSLWAACTDADDYSSAADLHLSFSQDTLRMDTVLTTIPTATYLLKVYNRNVSSLLISSIRLADGGRSGFRINVDGQKGDEFRDVAIAGKDSLHIFVEATLPVRGTDAIVAVRDSILFMLNGNRQEVKLWAYAQDAVLLRGKVIEGDTLIASRQPLLVYDSLCVAPGAHLTLAAGTHLYFHADAGMEVYGRLTVVGTLDAPVVLRGDRTDRLFSYLPYDRLPKQWKGVRLHASSCGNDLSYVDIHGGMYGIRCDSAGTERQKLLLENSVIRQVEGDALQLTACRAVIANCELSNAGGYCVSLLGGDYSFTHCTLANYFSWDLRNGTALLLQNEQNGTAYPLGAAIFRNCIVAGSGTDELTGVQAADKENPFNYYFSHCLINTAPITNEQVFNVVWAKDDNFRRMDNRTQLYNFCLTEASQAVDRGRAADAQSYPVDRNGHSRLADKAPDAGCYELN
ncbi:MAG: hypothetical protein LBN06_01200 [Prevotellaceae bacterium]|jgi:hypothetical protein|nr:hypothetical protein [Prevotellaceae bacterium]